MKDVIDCLEAAGRSGIAVGAVQGLELLPPEVKAALSARDATALRAALGLPAAIACIIAVPNDDQREFEDEPVVPDEQPQDGETHAA